MHAGVQCAPYFAEEAGGAATYGRYLVLTSSKSAVDSHVSMRELLVSRQDKPSAQRKFTHLHYHAWPDHDVPNHTASLRGLARMLDALTARTNGEVPGPPIVHCSAGGHLLTSSVGLSVCCGLILQRDALLMCAFAPRLARLDACARCAVAKSLLTKCRQLSLH